MASATATTVPTNTTQVHDQDRRRRHTIERAKATHLSRQLQLRLQYARLKVDHGWQKQNLNEVENLYFHHSQVRGTQPYPSPSLLATTQREGSPAVSNGTHSQSTVSFRLGTSPLSRAPTTVGPSSEPPHHDGRQHTPTETTPVLQPTSASTTPRPSISAADMKTLITMNADDEIKRSASPMNPPSGANTSGNPSTLQRTDTVIVAPEKSPGSSTTWSSASQPSAPLSPGYHSRASNSQSSTSTADSSRTFSSGSSLTYDSFWSSHSSSTATSSFRGSTAHILPPPASTESPATGSAGNGLNLVWEPSSFTSGGANTNKSPGRSRAPRSTPAAAGRPMGPIAGQEAIAAT